MGDIKLSICIATLNRGPFIGETLESIVQQATDQVEIVVLDGGSSDDTEEIVLAWRQQFPRLSYCRQQTNGGVDQDFARAVELARGEYCWLFSDDDILKQGAIGAVLNAIRGAYDLVIVNAEIRNADLSEVLQSRRLNLAANRTYAPEESDRLLADAGDYLSFIGCVVIKRQLWISREKEKYFGSCFVHVGVIFQSRLSEGAHIIAEPFIAIRFGNAMWLGKFFEIWMFKWPRLIWSFTQYPDSVKVHVCAKEPWRKMRTLLLFRAIGSYTDGIYQKWLAKRIDSWWVRMVARAIALCPGFLANLFAIVYYRLFCRRPGRLLVILNLQNSPFHFRKKPRKRSGELVPPISSV